MRGYITAKIFRYNPATDKEAYFKSYKILVEEEISVLLLLDRIQKEIDPTLSFKSFCCGLQMCGSCLVRIDGKKKFACLTIIKPGMNISIEPYKYPDSHIKDLVVKYTDDVED